MSEWTVDTLKEHLEGVLAERDEALKLQTGEYGRRLSSLNHAHEKAVEVQHTYVTDEKFGDFVKRYEENREVVAKALTLAEGKSVGSSAVLAYIFAAVTVVVSLAAVLATLLTH